MKFVIYNKKYPGFTLIEMAISITIFLIIIGVVVSIFLSIIKQQKITLADQEMLNQVSYAEEYISRGLRMATQAQDTSCLSTIGYIYELTHCAGAICNGIKFIDQSDGNACTEFFLDKNLAIPIVQEKKIGVGAQNLISDKFIGQSLIFAINGNTAIHVASHGGTVQPRVTILISFKPIGGLPVKSFQTTVSQRNLNVQ